MQKILIIEDEELMLKSLEFKLKKEGYEVVIASDGRDGSAKIKEQQFDLIITDIMMPFVSGLEVISLVRTEMKLTTPIIILSAVGLEDVVLEAFKLGADDFITKPFMLGELSIRVKKLIK